MKSLPSGFELNHYYPRPIFNTNELKPSISAWHLQAKLSLTYCLIGIYTYMTSYAFWVLSSIKQHILSVGVGRTHYGLRAVVLNIH
jgi:hypothetical protein